MNCRDCGKEITIRPCVFCRYKAAVRKLWKLAGMTLVMVVGVGLTFWGDMPEHQVLGALLTGWIGGYSWGMR